MPLDRTRLAALYETYSGLVHRRARTLLRDEQAAQDATQEVFLRLWRAEPDFEGGSPVAWLFQVTTNHCLNVLRDRHRRRGLLAEHAAAVASAGDGGHDVTLGLLLRGVPEHLQEIAIYYYVDEMSQDEIALVLRISQRTVSNRLKEFLALMKQREAARAAEAS